MEKNKFLLLIEGRLAGNEFIVFIFCLLSAISKKLKDIQSCLISKINILFKIYSLFENLSSFKLLANKYNFKINCDL